MSKKTKKPSKIVVIGTSSGGLSALNNLISQLQPGFPVPILVVMHVAANTLIDAFLRKLNKHNTIICMQAENGIPLLPGHLYLSPADYHLMLNDDETILISKGAQENRSRPAIDPLFRSAAVTFTNRVISIILTGYLDDGTSGMKVVKRCGGTCIVQDPADAEYPDMPQNILNHVEVDHCLPLAEMGGLLYQLIEKPVGRSKAVPKDILIEARIAKRVLSDLPSVNALGEQVPFNCPGCGGILWKIQNDKDLRYRCHTGHAYTAASLLAEQTEKIEETMWTALRMFEERKNLLTKIAQTQKGAAAKSATERAQTSQVHIDRIKAILHTDENNDKHDNRS